jgi:hypothetical protein
LRLESELFIRTLCRCIFFGNVQTDASDSEATKLSNDRSRYFFRQAAIPIFFAGMDIPERCDAFASANKVRPGHRN